MHNKRRPSASRWGFSLVALQQNSPRYSSAPSRLVLLSVVPPLSPAALQPSDSAATTGCACVNYVKNAAVIIPTVLIVVV